MTHYLNCKRSLQAVLLFVALCIATTALAQRPDTLHLYYNNISVQPHDTTLAKMDRWIKSLGGKHQNIRIVGYYHKLEFKKYAQERVDEMFLVVNRKARSLFTIEETVAKSGKNYQRTTVDIIYKPSVPQGADKAAGDKGKSEAVKAEPSKKSKDDEKSETRSDKKETSDDEAKPEKVKKEKAKKEDKDEKAKKGDDESEKASSDDEKKSEKVKKEKAKKEEKEEKSKKGDDDSEKSSSDDEKKSEKKEKKKEKKDDEGSDKDTDDDKKSDKKEKKSKSKPEKEGKTEQWEAKPIE